MRARNILRGRHRDGGIIVAAGPRTDIEIFANFYGDKIRLERNSRDENFFTRHPDGRIVRTVGDDPHPFSNPRRRSGFHRRQATESTFVCEYSHIGYNTYRVCQYPWASDVYLYSRGLAPSIATSRSWPRGPYPRIEAAFCIERNSHCNRYAIKKRILRVYNW